MVVSGVFCVPVLSVFGVLLSCELAVPEAPPADVVDEGVLAGAAPGSFGTGFVPGSCGGAVVSGTLAGGMVLVPPAGVCSLIGWLLCDFGVWSWALLLAVLCATVNPVDKSARVAMYVSFLMIVAPSFPVAYLFRDQGPSCWLPSPTITSLPL